MTELHDDSDDHDNDRNPYAGTTVAITLASACIFVTAVAWLYACFQFSSWMGWF